MTQIDNITNNEEKKVDVRTLPPEEYDTPAYPPRKRRFGDRKEGRKLRTLSPMNVFMPYIMPKRSDALNYFEDVIDITNVERYLDEKHREGYTDMTILHVILAAYTRIVSERPGVNRFVSGQKIYSRNKLECVMTIKKEMSLESPDTCIKVEFDPRDNIYNVYKKFRAAVNKALATDNNDFDNTARKLTKIPGFVIRAVAGLLNFLDYHGWLPKSLLNVSPFHGSMIISEISLYSCHTAAYLLPMQ